MQMSNSIWANNSARAAPCACRLHESSQQPLPRPGHRALQAELAPGPCAAVFQSPPATQQLLQQLVERGTVPVLLHCRRVVGHLLHRRDRLRGRREHGKSTVSTSVWPGNGWRGGSGTLRYRALRSREPGRPLGLGTRANTPRRVGPHSHQNAGSLWGRRCPPCPPWSC